MKRVLGKSCLFLLLTASIDPGKAAERPLPAPPLSAEFEKGRDLVLPSRSEKSYRTIPWRISVLHGLLDAQKKDRPVMIVLMNGHPLGCT